MIKKEARNLGFDDVGKQACVKISWSGGHDEKHALVRNGEITMVMHTRRTVVLRIVATDYRLRPTQIVEVDDSV